MWHEGWPQYICMSVWPLFHGIVIIPYISNTIWWRNIIPWILLPCETNSNLKIHVGHFDLHFTVQWFTLYLKDYLIEQCHTYFYAPPPKKWWGIILYSLKFWVSVRPSVRPSSAPLPFFCPQLLLQFLANPFQTLQALLGWSKDMHIVFSESWNYFLSQF